MPPPISNADSVRPKNDINPSPRQINEHKSITAVMLADNAIAAFLRKLSSFVKARKRGSVPNEFSKKKIATTLLMFGIISPVMMLKHLFATTYSPFDTQ